VQRILSYTLIVASLAMAAVPVASADARFRVIVNPQVRGNQIPRAALSSIFLKRAVRWGDGSSAQPVDQSMRSDVRRAFTADVLGQGLVEVEVYWHHRMEAGQVPPAVKTSDEDIVSFVAATPGAIGYVSPSAQLPPGVREITVVN